MAINSYMPRIYHFVPKMQLHYFLKLFY